MKTSPTLSLIRKLKSKSFQDGIAWLERRFNNLPGKARKLIAVAGGLFVAIICAELVIGALLFNRPSLDIPVQITSPTLQNKSESNRSADKMVPIGRLESNDDPSAHRLVAINNNGEYFIAQPTTFPWQQLRWIAVTTETLQLLEQHSTFIPISKDTTTFQ